MDIKGTIDNLTSGDLPAGTMGGGGLVLLLIALLAFKGFRKFLSIIISIALFAGAVLWHIYHRRS